jgi:succinylarginine dihydrolase
MSEIVYDGLIGPTFTFSGLGRGNVPSQKHAGEASSPKKAALQCLAKMKLLADHGVQVAVLPPHERPYIAPLRQLGYSGTDAEILKAADPDLLRACSSASAAWAANSANITAASDTVDGVMRITPANLASQFHRTLEVDTTSWLMTAYLPHAELLDPLPSHPTFGDEGQGNSIRLSNVTIRSYGGRQTKKACEAIDRLHNVKEGRTRHAELSPELIEAGVFHADLVATGHAHCLLYYEDCWVDTDRVIENVGLTLEVKRDEMPIEKLLESYLLNSQIFEVKGKLLWLLPESCRGLPVVDRLSSHFDELLYTDLSESQKAGGGPGCLSLRAPEVGEHNPIPLLSDPLYEALLEWVDTFYLESLTPNDLANPDLLIDVRQGLDILSQLLDLGPIYPFQQG